jgi:hypothetical protein
MSDIKQGDWVITKGRRIGFVGFEDLAFAKNDPHVYLYFWGDEFHCRSYKTSSLAKVDPSVAKILTDVHKEQVDYLNGLDINLKGESAND